MRESQKMRLDYRLHTKIIDSIIHIQRWFKTILQRFKFQAQRSAVVKIQSCWRMYVAQKNVAKMRLRINAVVIIQSAVRMFLTRRWYTKLVAGITAVQAQVRGKMARVRFKKMHRQSKLKERYKLRSTQSLPVTDKPVGGLSLDEPQIDVDFKRPQAKLTHYSLDLDVDLPPMSVPPIKSNDAKYLLQSTGDPSKYDRSDVLPNVLHKAEHQFRNLMISSTTTTANNNDGISMNVSRSDVKKTNAITEISEESVDSRSSRAYNLDNVYKMYDEAVSGKR